MGYYLIQVRKSIATCKRLLCKALALLYLDLHPFEPDCDHLLGVVLVEPRRHPRQSGAGRDHRAHHDHPNGLHQRRPAQDLLRQVHRRLPGRVLLHGVRLAPRSVHVDIRMKGFEYPVSIFPIFAQITTFALAVK